MGRDHPVSKPTAEQIRAQLDRILASKLFTLSNRLKAFLTFIVEAELEGQADRLKEFTLGIEVFGKDETFDPSIDSIVRVEASRLRSKLREYYGTDGRGDPVRIEVPKGHYVPVFRLIRRDQAPTDNNSRPVTGAPDSRAPGSSRVLQTAVLGISITALVYLLVTNFFVSKDPIAPVQMAVDESIAVLPFVSMSSGENDGYFADGLTEEILSSLARLPELRVTARTSSFFFKGKNLPVPEIAARLGVAHVVEGSVRRDGERLRIAAQLIRASDGTHLWSQTFEPMSNDIFEVQQEIAEKIAEVLGVVLDDAARDAMHGAGINDVEAFIAYQKGQEAFAGAHQGMNMSDALAIANVYFDSALDAAPGLTSARLMRADLRGHLLFEVAAGIRDEHYPGEQAETLAALQEEYQLAVQFSPVGNQRDILDLERVLFSNQWNTLPAKIGKAMQSSGCSQVNWTNAFISPFGWAAQLKVVFEGSIACDPLDSITAFHLAMALIWSGDSDAALRFLAGAEDRGLSHLFLDDARFWALLATGQVDDPLTIGPGAEQGNMPYNRQILRQALSGDAAVARQLADLYWAGSSANDFSSLVIAAVIGDREKANEVAARIDAFPGSAVVLSSAIFTCLCGAPFDLDATPNFRLRVEEARLSWPPLTRIDYPAKTW